MRLKVPKCEILVSWILMIFFIMKPIQVGDLRAEIKFLHFLQMGEILVILFQLQHVPSTLAICNRIRQQSATACDVYTNTRSPSIPYCFSYRMRRLRQQSATVCGAYAAICQRMRRLRQQVAILKNVFIPLIIEAPPVMVQSKHLCRGGYFLLHNREQPSP